MSDERTRCELERPESTHTNGRATQGQHTNRIVATYCTRLQLLQLSRLLSCVQTISHTQTDKPAFGISSPPAPAAPSSERESRGARALPAIGSFSQPTHFSNLLPSIPDPNCLVASDYKTQKHRFVIDQY